MEILNKLLANLDVRNYLESRGHLQDKLIKQRHPTNRQGIFGILQRQLDDLNENTGLGYCAQGENAHWLNSRTLAK